MRTIIISALCLFSLFGKTEEKLFSFINYLFVSWFLLLSLSWFHHFIRLLAFYLWNYFVIRRTFTLFDLFIFRMFFDCIILAICPIFLVIFAYWKAILTVFWFIGSSYALFLKSFWLVQLFSNLFEGLHLFKLFTFMILEISFEVVIIFWIQ